MDFQISITRLTKARYIETSHPFCGPPADTFLCRPSPKPLFMCRRLHTILISSEHPPTLPQGSTPLRWMGPAPRPPRTDDPGTSSHSVNPLPRVYFGCLRLALLRASFCTLPYGRLLRIVVRISSKGFKLSFAVRNQMGLNTKPAIPGENAQKNIAKKAKKNSAFFRNLMGRINIGKTFENPDSKRDRAYTLIFFSSITYDVTWTNFHQIFLLSPRLVLCVPMPSQVYFFGITRWQNRRLRGSPHFFPPQKLTASKISKTQVSFLSLNIPCGSNRIRNRSFSR